MMKTNLKIIMFGAAAFLAVSANGQAQQTRYYAKRMNGGTAIIEVRPGLAQKILALPKRTFNTAVAMTEPAPSQFGGRITQADMANGSKTQQTLLDRTENLTVNTVKTASDAGGAVVNTGVGITKTALRLISPY